MIDIHCHIIPNIDDGSRSNEETIEILHQAEENGVTDIIVTPHFILGSLYNKTKKENKEKLKEIQELVKKENIKINLHLGNEIYIDEKIVDLLKEKKTATMNDSKYVLFELPLNSNCHNLNSVIFELQSNGYIPILAHPERYRFLKENPILAEDLLSRGVLFQCNIGSFFEKYGREARKLAELFLKHNMITFISSDTHHETSDFYYKINNLKEKLLKITTEEYLIELLEDNARKVITNQKIEPREIIPIKKTIFKKYI